MINKNRSRSTWAVRAPPLRFERRLLPPEGSALSSELWGLFIEEFYHVEINIPGISILDYQPGVLNAGFFRLNLKGKQDCFGPAGVALTGIQQQQNATWVTASMVNCLINGIKLYDFPRISRMISSLSSNRSI